MRFRSGHLFGVVAAVFLLAGGALAEPMARFTDDGALMRPEGYREWVFLGATVQPKDSNFTTAYSPGIKHAYVDRESFAHWKKTGTFPTGAVIVQERVEARRKEFMNAVGYFAGKHVGLQVMVRDPKRFPETVWGFFSFGKPPYADKVWPIRGTGELDCGGCHSYADQDWVFTGFYPMLADAAPEKRSDGQQLFERDWTPATNAHDDTGDGLGPLFHARSCNACHPKGGRGEVAFRKDGTIKGDSLLLRVGLGEYGDPVYGKQIQHQAIRGHKAEGVPAVRFTDVTDPTGTVLRKPQFELRNPAYGALDKVSIVTGRVSPAVFGNGDLERVPLAHLKGLEDPQDANGDGISGRLNRIRLPMGGIKYGRFGWKAGQWDLTVQTAKALRMDMGLSTKLLGPAWGDCTAVQKNCTEAPGGERAVKGGREVSMADVKSITEHTAGFPAPKRRGHTSDGEALFAAVGCAACHVPRLPVAGGGNVAAYTDLLLHDMGLGLADGLKEETATGSEWRTAPLMGLGRLMAKGDPLLHDGRARDAHEAILWHGGEGARAAQAYRDLSAADRARLMKFLETL